MKLVLSILSAAALVTAHVATASAQPSMARDNAPTTSPTQFHAADLSQINGNPVPVGEHNEYYYSFPRFNLSANPLGWVVGLYGVSASYAVHDQVAIRGGVTFLDPVGSDETGVELDAGVPIYFRRVYSGVFLEPGIMVRHLKEQSGDAIYEEEVAGPQVLVGWHWRWDSGLNVAVAVGMGRNLAGDSSSDEAEVFGNGYLRFGYAF
ncbi:MAG TPA: hypothetical protein VFG83_08600 [Kofleriaceae bacterium]|nr:hypothetical protein [Kofleriaceae bacterium]